MFNKEKFSNILQKISNTYPNMTEFAKKANLDRTYISKYVHKKLDNPPSLKVLIGISNASNGLVTFYDLMEMCGYIKSEKIKNAINNINLTDIYMQAIDKKINCIPLIYNLDFSKPNLFNENYIIDYIPFTLNTDNIENYFAYKVQDDSMLPLIGIDDIAILEKTNTYESGQTCLISLDNKEILIRKIIDFKDYIELHTAFSYSQPIKLTKEELIDRNFKTLGKVIRIENESAFK